MRVALATVAMLAGCSDVGSSKLTIMLTDAPPAADIRAAGVTIDQIYLQGEGGRFVLRDRPFATDLLVLSDDVATLVQSATVPTGIYTQLSFVIGGGYIVVGEDNEVYATPGYVPSPSGDLRTPSWDASGFKVSLPDGNVRIDDEERVLVVDFDVGESFGQLADGAWMMRPVLRAFDFLASGSISINLDVGAVSLTGALTAELDDAAGNVEAIHEVDDRDGDGVIPLSFMVLDPRESPFRLTLSGVMTSPPMPIEVALASGQSVSVDVVVTELVSTPR